MRRIRTMLAGFILAGSGILMMPGSAQAASGCPEHFVDLTTDSVLDQTKVEQTSAKLEDVTGADVYVLAFETAPSGSLDAFREQVVQNCPAWRSPGMDLKGNLMVFMFSMDRQSAIYYGANFTEKLDSKVDGIRNDKMGDRFREGDFTAGIINAQDAVIDVYTPSKAGTYFAWTMAVVIGIAAIVGLAFGFVHLRRARRRKEQQRLVAQKQAVSQSDEASKAIELVSMDDVERDFELVTTDLNEDDLAELNHLMRTARSLSSTAIEADYQRINRSADLNPEAKRTAEQYQRIAEVYADILSNAIQAKAAIDALQSRCDQLSLQKEKAPEDYAALWNLHETLIGIMNALERDGYQTEVQDDLNQMSRLLDVASGELDQKRYGQAIDELKKIQEIGGSVQERLAKLRTVRQELQSRHGALSDRLQSLYSKVQDNTVLDQLRANYGEQCWRALQDRRDGVIDSLDRASKPLDKAVMDASMESQRWKQSRKALDEAEQLIDSAERYLGELDEYSRKLNTLSQTLPGRLRNTQSDAASAISTIGGYKGSHDRRISRLSQIEHELRQLERDLQKSQPELIEIDLSVVNAQNEIEKLLSKAESEHSRIKREQREAEERRRRDRERQSSSYGTGYSTGSIIGSSGFGSSSGGSSGGWGGSSGGSSGGW